MTQPTPEVVAALESEALCWFTTVRRDGQPQSSVVWFGYDAAGFLMFSQPDARRIANITRHPRVSISVHSSANKLAITVEGVAVANGEPTETAVAAYVAKYGDRMASMGYRADTFFAEYSTAVRIGPTKWRVHDLS